MSDPIAPHRNVAYQEAASPLGGSYTANKMARLHLPELAGKRFLDLGCNAGFYCKYALDQGASRVVGVDVDQQVIAQAREKHAEVQFLDTGWDVFPDETFDVIICLSAIHYARDPIALARNIWSHLAGGGLFVLEGGVVDGETTCKTNILIPGWRTVGDQCRHLSMGFLRSHLLRDFDWKVIGPSEPREGDDVPRQVVHAIRAQQNPPEHPRCFRIDVLEYAQALSLSARTIAPGFPSYNYVKALGNAGTLTPRRLEDVLSDERNFSAFVNDLAFALERQTPATLTFTSSVPHSLLLSLTTALSGKDPSIRCETTQEPTVIRCPPSPGPKTLSDYVLALKKMQDNLGYGDLTGKVVADLATGDPNIHQSLLQSGVRQCYVVGGTLGEFGDRRLVPVEGSPFDAALSDIDVAFLDARSFNEACSVAGIAKLMRHVERILKPQGFLFAVFRTSRADEGFDVYNSIVQTPCGALPSQSFFYNELLQDYSVRLLDLIPSETALETIGFYRITRKKPALLLILGSSHSGKTSLAREFIRLDRHIHVSNDYIYCEIARLKRTGIAHGLSERIAARVGNGGGEACGEFNRALETDVELLNDYLRLMLPLIPTNKKLVTMDWDLVKADHVAIVKEFFTNAGFSVWTVMR